MRIAVCVRQGTDGEICPFDGAAYESALQIPNAEVILLSMGPSGTLDWLKRLTRLGAQKAVLLCDPAFAGADTLATAYTLSKAIGLLHPQLVLCGRQTTVGDTAQTGVMLSVFAGMHLETNVIQLEATESGAICHTRTQEAVFVPYPAVLTVERLCDLRLPSLRSKVGATEVWDLKMLGAEVSRCGAKGSPTCVVKTFQNESDRRKCRMLAPEELEACLSMCLQKDAPSEPSAEIGAERLSHAVAVGAAVIPVAARIAERVSVFALTDAETMARKIRETDADAVLWGSDPLSKRRSAEVAAMLDLGLCADCTRLECANGALMMFRPAFSGNVIAEIKSRTRPAMATVRTAEQAGSDLVVAAGYGAANLLSQVEAFCKAHHATMAASRRLVDSGRMPYAAQVGLTGKSVAPKVYLALGVSGAIHHIAGMKHSGVVIAVNKDRNAPIFDYADFGIVADVTEILGKGSKLSEKELENDEKTAVL